MSPCLWNGRNIFINIALLAMGNFYWMDIRLVPFRKLWLSVSSMAQKCCRIIDFLDTVRRCVFYLKTTFQLMNSVSPSSGHQKIGTSSVNLAQVSRPLLEDGEKSLAPETSCLNKKTERWIFSKKSVIVLMYQRDILLDVIYRNSLLSTIQHTR
jgi:hypothetical protein